MIPIRNIQLKKKDVQYLVLSKSLKLDIYEMALLAFWVLLTVLCFMDESKLVMLSFYGKHLPAGLLLLPTKTKLILAVPLLMSAASFTMWSFRVIWLIDRGQQKIIRSYRILFFIKTLKKEWSFADILCLRLTKQNKRAPYVLEWETQGGKRIFLDSARGSRKLASLAEEITGFTNLKLAL